MRTLAFVLLLALLTTMPVSARAAWLSGTVLDAWTDAPAAGIRVVVEGTGLVAETDAHGRYSLEVSDDRRSYTLWLSEDDISDPYDLRWQHQRAGESGVLRIIGAPDGRTAFPAWGGPMDDRPPGPAAEPRSVESLLGRALPGGLTLPGSLPETIRVGRRFASTCSGYSVTRIDEVTLEEYVQGVLVPEIGVFKRIAGGPESARAVFEAFAVAARSYALWFWIRDPDADYHIDDTACNQRYDDARDAFIAEAVEATAGLILVSASDSTTIDKYEYAASCGRFGSRPAYQDALVPDDTGEEACVGSWCGHNDCAAHEVNPAHPDDGRCLVRGICQWGASERSMHGETWEEILAHYQPNLRVIRIGDPLPARLVGFVREGDIAAGPGIPGVTVSVETGGEDVTDETGYFAIEAVEPGVRMITYSGGGIVPAVREKDCAAGITNWASLAAERIATSGDDAPDGGGEFDGDAGADDLGEPADATRDAIAADAGRDADTSPREPDAGDDSLPDALNEADGPADPATRDASAAAPVLPVYDEVSGSGLGDTGCACSVDRRSGRLSARALAGAALVLIAVARGGWRLMRRRSVQNRLNRP